MNDLLLRRRALMANSFEKEEGVLVGQANVTDNDLITAQVLSRESSTSDTFTCTDLSQFNSTGYIWAVPIDDNIGVLLPFRANHSSFSKIDNTHCTLSGASGFSILEASVPNTRLVQKGVYAKIIIGSTNSDLIEYKLVIDGYTTGEAEYNAGPYGAPLYTSDYKRVRGTVNYCYKCTTIVYFSLIWTDASHYTVTVHKMITQRHITDNNNTTSIDSSPIEYNEETVTNTWGTPNAASTPPKIFIDAKGPCSIKLYQLN